MSAVTFSYAADWNPANWHRGAVHSHRSTTSSRHPGVKIEGTVSGAPLRLERCPDCGGVTHYPGPGHSLRHFGRELVDCAGRRVAP